MAAIDSTHPPAPGNPSPIACVLDVNRVGAALRIKPDHGTGLVMVTLAAEPLAGVILPPEGAFDLALRLIGAVNQLRRPPEGRP
jgi:hypothetical protein